VAKALAWPRVGQAARWAVGASGAGIEEKRRNERMRESEAAPWLLMASFVCPPNRLLKSSVGD